MKLKRFIINSLAVVGVLVFYSFLIPEKSVSIFLTDNFQLKGKFLYPPEILFAGDSLDSVLTYPLPNPIFPYTGEDNGNPFYLGDPDSLQTDVEYDPETGLYKVKERMGNLDIGSPNYMNLEDYRKLDMDQSLDAYWKEQAKTAGAGGNNGIIPSIYIGGKAFDKVFGGNSIDIRPAGSVTLKFGLRGDRTDNPDTPERLRRQVNFDFKEDINMSVHASIGEKIGFNINYNTKATFDFENKMKLGYTGTEDEIIQSIEAGNVTLPLNSTLITGSQSLFGIKTKLKFGRTTVTTVFSEQEGESKTIAVEGGGMRNEFKIKADDYEENKHFFLNHFFRGNYERSLKDLRLISSPINITKIEVWVTNIGPAVTENRNVVAFTDLGEVDPEAILNNTLVQQSPNSIYGYPDNQANNLLDKNVNVDLDNIRNLNNVNTYLLSRGFDPNADFEKIELAKRLGPSDYTYNARLGFISLNMPLNDDQALAVAYQYQVVGDTSQVYQVGEFSDQGIVGEDALAVKLLRGTYVDVASPLWDLMMKNVYSLHAYQINSQDFLLNILYSGNESGVLSGYFESGPFEGVPLLHVFNLDNLDAQQSPYPDGMFDFVDNASTQGGTIESQKGRIFFPVLEPFGSYLRDTLNDDSFADKVCFDELYELTKTAAAKFADKNKFVLAGYYKSQSGNEIDLHAMNVPRGSVKVTAGGIELQENSDYTVDYTLGRVRIINEGILNSGTPINVSLESKDMFSVITKRMMGTHIDYDISDDFHLGGTIMNLSERPLTQKVNYGDDPISNTIWGVDYAYNTKSRLITKIVDKLPFYSTSQESAISVDGEFAHFIPGHHRAVGKEGISYIDDFEGTKSTIDMRYPNFWSLASVPQGQDELFVGASGEMVESGKNRAKMSWYIIDNTVFYSRSTSLRPKGITDESLSNNYVRRVDQLEVFPNTDVDGTLPTNIAVLDVSYFPDERGPYNYNTEDLKEDGTLENPNTKWAGMMREIETSDFEAANVEYIEFWMMDPFAEGSMNDGSGGDLYFNLGDISEDILRDSRKSFENGLPTTADNDGADFDTTAWALVPDKLNIVESFSNDVGSREFQDVGYDGWSDNMEKEVFAQGSNLPEAIKVPYLSDILAQYPSSSQAYQNADKDPSGDNFHHYRGDDYDADPLYSGSIIMRYKNYRGPDGNSPEADANSQVFMGNSHQPDAEDINGDNTLSEGERYYQYRVQLRPNKLQIGENYVTDIQVGNNITLPNGETSSVNWYQFKIPIRSYSKKVGNISDFRSIRFMRMMLSGFSKPIVLRFATLDLVRGEWRTYPDVADLLVPGEVMPNSAETEFNMSAVSYEENAKRQPIPYMLPPGIEREQNASITRLTKQNEQALSLKVKDLQDGAVVAAYKTTDLDIRQYKKLKMFVHAERMEEMDIVKYGDLSLFVRIGSDFTQNYYDYEIPLTFSEWGVVSAEDIWPADNEMQIDLEKLVAYKNERNIAMRSGSGNFGLSIPYYAMDGKNKITIMGSPTISDVQSIMIGIRNPKKTNLSTDDDGLPKSAEIWVNELRLTDFSKKSGWAARSRLAVNIADLGNVAVSGMYSSPWFASIDQKINEIQLEGVTQLDVATNLDLGKLLPKAINMTIPMHYDFSQTVIAPKFNPLDPDIDLKEEINSYETSAQRDSVRANTMDITTRRNLNFMNVRVNKSSSRNPRKAMPQPSVRNKGKKVKAKAKKNHFYDLSNVTASYSYAEIDQSNIDLDFDRHQTYFGSLAYAYSFRAKPIKPFEKISFIKKSPYLKFIKEFNFFVLPKSISYSTDMNRTYNSRLLRNKSIGNIIMNQTDAKTWDWKQTFNFSYALTQAININFSSNTISFINEFPGAPNQDYKNIYSPNQEVYTVQMKKDTIERQLKSGGIKKHYDHNASIDYTLPFKHFPLLDWVSSTAGYQATYQWNAPAYSMQTELGNVVANNRNYNLNSTFNFKKLYNKSKFLKKVLKKSKRKKKKKKKEDKKGKKGKESDKNSKEKKTSKKKKEEDKINYFEIAYKTAIRAVLGVKKVNFTYAVNEGTTMPGFRPEPGAFGNDWGIQAPGYEFLLGSQPGSPEYFDKWLVMNPNINTPFMTQYNETFSAKATLEPIQDFSIKLKMDKAFSNNLTAFYVYDDTTGVWGQSQPMESGSFLISTISWGTAFGGGIEGDKSKYFEIFKEHRREVASRIAADDPRDLGTNTDNGFPIGYGPYSPSVLLPAFIAAYSGKPVKDTKLNPFAVIPLPNWSISYKGLSKIPWIEDIFESFTIDHKYSSSFAINSYQRSVNYKYDQISGFEVPTAMNDINGDFYTKYEYGMVSITESFEPLIGIKLKMQNSLQLNARYTRSRNLTLSFANNQLTEITANVFVLGTGYTFKNLRFKLKSRGAGSSRLIESDLILKLDVGINENKTVLRAIDTDLNQISAGMQKVSIKFSADYQLSKSLMTSLFYDRIFNNPFLPSQYVNANSFGGISIRYSLAQ